MKNSRLNEILEHSQSENKSIEELLTDDSNKPTSYLIEIMAESFRSQSRRSKIIEEQQLVMINLLEKIVVKLDVLEKSNLSPLYQVLQNELGDIF